MNLTEYDKANALRELGNVRKVELQIEVLQEKRDEMLTNIQKAYSLLDSEMHELAEEANA